MTQLSLARAAALTGKSKSTLARAIKSGRMTATRRADGTFALDPSEVMRAYPDAMRDASHGAPRIDHPAAPDAVQQSAQQSEIKALRDDLAAARQAAAVAEALAHERARALEAAERNLADLRRMLPAPSGAASARPWWRLWP